jgi:hypothetical protein
MLSGCELIDTENISLSSQDMKFAGEWTKIVFCVFQMIDWFLVFNATFSNTSAISWWPVLVNYPKRTTDHGQATGKLYHLRLRVECTLFVIYKAGHEPYFFRINHIHIQMTYLSSLNQRKTWIYGTSIRVDICIYAGKKNNRIIA